MMMQTGMFTIVLMLLLLLFFTFASVTNLWGSASHLAEFWLYLSADFDGWPTQIVIYWWENN